LYRLLEAMFNCLVDANEEVKLEMTRQKQDLDSIVREAVAFHGHLGPFLVIGVRMGLIGLRELKTSGSDFDLQAIAILKQTPPFSCAIDGIQVTTHCTVGNGKLKLKDKPDIVSAVFEANKERQVTVTLKPTKYEDLKKELPKDRQSYKNIQLAREITSAPEEILFTIEKK
jgi:formylmethanofuran dehydrogenase subunit E